MMQTNNPANSAKAIADLLKAKLPRIKAKPALALAILEKIKQSPQ